eukprot:scaffold1027_cov413-Prasinococcus_capsulatus_cf.AAC.11
MAPSDELGDPSALRQRLRSSFRRYCPLATWPACCLPVGRVCTALRQVPLPRQHGEQGPGAAGRMWSARSTPLHWLQ